MRGKDLSIALSLGAILAIGMMAFASMEAHDRRQHQERLACISARGTWVGGAHPACRFTEDEVAP